MVRVMVVLKVEQSVALREPLRVDLLAAQMVAQKVVPAAARMVELLVDLSVD